jgi:aspartate kinase
LFTGHTAAGAGRVLIATGFIARSPTGVPTTLKRNGSDYSATIFGAMLIAKTITIWTDVDGVYSADPRKVKEAVCLESLSYNEAWELSYFGANVLHPRTTLPAMRYHIPVVLRNYFNQAAPGTSICDQCEVTTNDDGAMNPIDVNSDRSQLHQRPRNDRGRHDHQRRGNRHGRRPGHRQRGVPDGERGWMQRRHDLAGVLGALHLLRRAQPRSRRRGQGA